jgi:chorismate dehydratase
MKMISPQQLLRIAAIDFLNPAPLMWDFEHPPLAVELASRYEIQRMTPAQCAASLAAGSADLGLIPVAALTPELAIVPGCVIASLDQVRSIQLIVRGDRELKDVRTVAADTASRSSLAYANILFRKFLNSSPSFVPHAADPVSMLQSADAALLIGDPALLALGRRDQIEAAIGACQWFDVAQEWTSRTGLPWVAAVWAVRPESVERPAQLVEDLNNSRDHGLAHVGELVAEWSTRIAIPPAVIRNYLTRNIHYKLDQSCIDAILLFRSYATEIDLLPPLRQLRFI